MVAVDSGLYIRITKEGTPFWVFRYSYNSKRRQMIMGQYGRPPEHLPLKEAKDLAAVHRTKVRQGIDPLIEKGRAKAAIANTLNDVADDWLKECEKRLQTPQIPKRVYEKDIAPAIGRIPVKQLTSADILAMVRKISASNRPSIANDALSYSKQLLNHAMKLGLVQFNAALPLTHKDAGGVEQSRSRALTFNEIEKAFQVFADNTDIFTRENYIALGLLLCLGVRKTELTAAKWEEFDLTNLTWTLPAERTKTGNEIRIPIPEPLIEWFTELRYRANGSEYVFPNRRKSKRRGYISDDTLNHALAKIFGQKVDSKKEPYPNLLADAGVDYFVVHDLRRTCRSLLAELAIPPHIAERCLNHKIRGVEGVYDRYDYFNERKDALTALANSLKPILFKD